METRHDEFGCFNHFSPEARIIHSIASQEGALACILNAECAKLHKAICLANNVAELTAINVSVTNLIDAIANLENQLRQKLELVTDEV